MTHIDKCDFIAQAMNLYDENEKLKAEIARLKATNVSTQHTTLSAAKSRIYEVGKTRIIKDSLSYFTEVSTKKNCGHIVTETFKEWVNHAVDNDKIPTWLSRDTFMEICEETLQLIYEQESKNALMKTMNEDHE